MKKLIFLIVVTFTILSCQTRTSGDPARFQQGIFEIPAGKGYSKTIITRVDSLQIEKYTRYIEVSTDSGVYTKEIDLVDTLYIKWKNNFFYTLRMKSPKKDIDRDPIFVQITRVTDNSYEFTAKIGYSKFKQDGTVYKVE